MKRKSFLKSLLIGIASPRTIIEAAKDNQICAADIGQLPNHSFVKIEWPISAEVKEIIDGLVAKYKSKLLNQ
jgi:hypothetical protein